MQAHNKHVFVCTGICCSHEGKNSTKMFLQLAEKIDSNPNLNIKLTRSNCFAECENGPILVVYPEGIWYGNVDEAVLERILTEHLLHDQVVSEYIFHRLGEA
ncbi:MAG: ferredoxin [Methylococcaceae bacterium]|jgi:(2Fe-2S) ferredoxin